MQKSKPPAAKFEVRTKTDPAYYHKVVDCQYACPAHTPVPEYIRLIAQKRYTEAYLVNRQSNVFPGILGRVCDRPCEPACRRGRVDEKPVAICRLKRAAADYKDADYRKFLPAIPPTKNGHRIALIGAGPASLTVANDLMPLGYECVLFEKDPFAGGAMALQVPAFRLPHEVLQEEIGNILDMGVETRFGKAVSSLRAVIAEGFSAVFVGCGAPLAKDLPLPGRKEAGGHVHLGLEFLANIAFDHIDTIGERVAIIGGGNTAMDCCRSALRLGAKEVLVFAPEAFDKMLASPWEKEDALHEGVKFFNQLLPQEFVCQNDKLTGIRFRPLISCYDQTGRFNPQFAEGPDQTFACDAVVLAVGQDLFYPFIDDDLLEWENITTDGKKKKVRVDPKTYQSSDPRVFFGGDAAFGPKNIITAVAQGHQAALSIDMFCKKLEVSHRPPDQMRLTSQKMAMNQWAYNNSYLEALRQQVPEEQLLKRLKNPKLEVEMGFDPSLAATECGRCLNCDVQTVFTESLCIECDACVDICPVQCLSITKSTNDEEVFFAPLPQTGRLMIKDEDVCVHCGLCAERCPTTAWDMQAFELIQVKAGNQ